MYKACVSLTVPLQEMDELQWNLFPLPQSYSSGPLNHLMECTFVFTAEQVHCSASRLCSQHGETGKWKNKKILFIELSLHEAYKRHYAIQVHNTRNNPIIHECNGFCPESFHVGSLISRNQHDVSSTRCLHSVNAPPQLHGLMWTTNLSRQKWCFTFCIHCQFELQGFVR